MADYIAKLKDDLVEQFRGKANIDGLMEVIGAEFQQIFDFYAQLSTDRDVRTAIGKQLDGVGDIVDLSRMEAGQLAGNPIPYDILDDETYRQYLIYKILKNNCDCTYPDIIKAFRMFWDRPIYYSDDPEQPATMIFDTGEMEGPVDTRPLFKTPLIRAAGVTLKLYARTSTKMAPSRLYLAGALGYAFTESILPVVERDYDFRGKLNLASGFHTVSQSTLHEVERASNFGFRLKLGTGFHSIDESSLLSIERTATNDALGDSASTVVNMMETSIGGVVIQE